MEIDKIKKVMMGKASREEREEVESWAGGSAERKRFVEDARGFYAGEEIPDGEIEQRMRRIWQTMPVSIWRRRMIFRWAAAVACVLLAVGIGWSVWLPGTREGRMMPDGQEQGVQAVQLLLSDGSRHELGPGRLSGSIPGFRVDTGGVIRQEAVASGPGGDTVRYGEIMVPRGGEYRMVLADGTRVMLNAETRLRFPEAFGDGERRVFLEGEAYFEVAKERERPFWVDFREGTVRVLGTQFNVKAYGGEEAVATLVHGKVEVARGQEAVVLQPGEQCRIAAGEAHALIVGKADLVSTLAWKNGEFVFKDASLEQVIDELARWYNVEMVYDHSLFRESRVHIYMNRSQTLDEALDMLSKAWDIRYERQGTKVWLGERHTGGTDSD